MSGLLEYYVDEGRGRLWDRIGSSPSGEEEKDDERRKDEVI